VSKATAKYLSTDTSSGQLAATRTAGGNGNGNVVTSTVVRGAASGRAGPTGLPLLAAGGVMAEIIV
jgi:hypothetical protein